MIVPSSTEAYQLLLAICFNSLNKEGTSPTPALVLVSVLMPGMHAICTCLVETLNSDRAGSTDSDIPAMGRYALSSGLYLYLVSIWGHNKKRGKRKES